MVSIKRNDEAVTKTIKISADDIKHVIGKGEKKLKFIRLQSHCKINIFYQSTRQSACEITGTNANIEHALNLIREVIQNKIPQQIAAKVVSTKNYVQQVINIPLIKCGALIGKNGKTIKQMQETLNVEMILPYSGNYYETKPLLISGQPDKVKFACQIVQDFIKREDGKQRKICHDILNPFVAAGDKKLVYKNLHLQNVNENHQTTVYMRVRLNKVKAVLGENGETLKQICRESGAKIELSEKEPFNQFVLRGTTAQVQSGECLIREKTIQLPTHFNQQKPSDLQILPQNKVNVKHCTNEEVRPTFECGICFESFKIEEGCISCEVNAFTLEPTKEIHTVCIHCMRGYAHSAVNDIPVAFGGTGLQCASPECKNIFTLPTFEFYLSDEDYLPLKLRLQEQCLADASLEDLVICPGCGFKFCALTMTEYYRCVCGRVQCKFCPRLYNAEHIGKTCQLLDKEEEAKSVSSQKLEAKISEAVIRKCYKCGIAFVKIDGCNKMQCRCGGKQCYVCRQKNINYDHFCRCGNIEHGKCSTCHKTCKLFENAEELDQIKINELQRQHHQQQQRQEQGKPNTKPPSFFDKIVRLFQ